MRSKRRNSIEKYKIEKNMSKILAESLISFDYNDYHAYKYPGPWSWINNPKYLYSNQKSLLELYLRSSKKIKFKNEEDRKNSKVVILFGFPDLFFASELCIFKDEVSYLRFHRLHENFIELSEDVIEDFKKKFQIPDGFKVLGFEEQIEGFKSLYFEIILN